MFLVSACLIGFPCRYNAVVQKDARMVDALLRSSVPVCPEVLGGLAIPRPPAEIRSDLGAGSGLGAIAGTSRVVNTLGIDVTQEYLRGAERALYLALQSGCRAAILKARSPACGAGFIYDGTFTHTQIPGDGVFAALLRSQGFRVYTEEQMEEALRDPAIAARR